MHILIKLILHIFKVKMIYKIFIAVEYIPYFFGYKKEVLFFLFLTILKIESHLKISKLFCKGITLLVSEFHMTELNIWGLRREQKTPFYIQINTVPCFFK